MRFKGKTALITGSGRGIGRAIALRLAGEGADVVINFFRNRKPAEETAAECEACGVSTYLVKADVGDPAEIERMFQEVGERFGGLDVLVNNAASGYIRPVMEQKVKGWDWTMNINARSHLLTAQQAVPLMQQRGGGAIVAISSLGSQYVLPEYVVVGVSKAAAEAVTRYLAVELAQFNIRCNAVSGGVVDTDALKFFKSRDEMIGQSRERTPAGRMVEPEDIAAAVAFLCSDDAAMIRGQTIVVDGGYTLAMH